MIPFLAHWFTCASSILFEFWNFGDDGFCGRRKTGEREEKPSEQSEYQQQPQPAYDTRPESNLGNIDRRRAISPCSAPSLLSIPAFMGNLR